MKAAKGNKSITIASSGLTNLGLHTLEDTARPGPGPLGHGWMFLRLKRKPTDKAHKTSELVK